MPVVRRLLVAPPEATVELGVQAGSNSVVELAGLGFDVPIVPRQAAIPDSTLGS